MREKKIFRFKHFSIRQEQTAMKVGTDGVLLGAWAPVSGVTRILDIGTGTGLIALMLAQRTSENTFIDAIEIEQHAFEEACYNVAQSPWKNRITVYHMELQEFTSSPYDLIVCNPPFFQNSMPPPDSKRGLARHDEKLPMQMLANHGKRLLAENGSMCIIAPHLDEIRIRTTFLREKLFCNHATAIRTAIKKLPECSLMNFSFSSQIHPVSELVLLDDMRNRTEAYSALTEDFYLKR